MVQAHLNFFITSIFLSWTQRHQRWSWVCPNKFVHNWSAGTASVVWSDEDKMETKHVLKLFWLDGTRELFCWHPSAPVLFYLQFFYVTVVFFVVLCSFKQTSVSEITSIYRSADEDLREETLFTSHSRSNVIHRQKTELNTEHYYLKYLLESELASPQRKYLIYCRTYK